MLFGFQNIQQYTKYIRSSKYAAGVDMPFYITIFVWNASKNLRTDKSVVFIEIKTEN